MRKNRKWSVCNAALLEFPAKLDIIMKIKEICHLENTKPEQKPLAVQFFLDNSSSSRDMMENRKWSVSAAAILDFPAKQNIVLKIKELCHLEHKISERMPFKFLRYLI